MTSIKRKVKAEKVFTVKFDGYTSKRSEPGIDIFVKEEFGNSQAFLSITIAEAKLIRKGIKKAITEAESAVRAGKRTEQEV